MLYILTENINGKSRTRERVYSLPLIRQDGGPFDESPNQRSDPVTQAWCYGYGEEEAVRWALAEERCRGPNVEGQLEAEFSAS